jgi:dTDP-4-amino-4,6-dideoxygalactose transaminase
MINVTKPFLPSFDEYKQYLEGIWERNWLTNNGPLVNELELRLKDYLEVKHVLYLNNGTIALQIAIKALGLTGEVITTPFSYVATTSSLVWENCKPVFVDIDKDTLNIDPTKIEAAITERTTGIMATHVYGNPCDVEAIEKIAKKHNLKVIYDGAHAFGVRFKGKSVFDYGDVTTASFHATKVYHTIEGGAVMTTDPELLKVMSRLRNFGHSGVDTFEEAGINGKSSEFHAAMGLANLKHIDDIMLSRKRQALEYNRALATLKVKRPVVLKGSDANNSYYPIVFETEAQLEKSVAALHDNRIYPRRYFYPSLSTLNYVDKGNVPIAEDISPRVLCLPMFHSLRTEDIDFIARILLRVQNN